MDQNISRKKLLKFYKRTKLETSNYVVRHKKKLTISCIFTFCVFVLIRNIFFINFGDTMEKEEIYNFINNAVDRCLQKKTRYEQNKEFALIKSSLPIKPVKMTLTTAVLKRIIVNKKTPIFEDKIALKLEHPHLVKSYKSNIRTYRDINNETQTLIWLYMEYLPYKVSQSYVKKDEKIIKQIAYDLLLGLQYLHNNNIAHLDLKIANIMGFNHNNEIRYKIIDFGYSRVVNKEIYLPGKNYGTFPYKPPEVVFNSIHGLKSDIWCVGAILLFLRVERTLFYDSDNKKDKALYEKFLSGRYKIKYPSDISPELRDLIKGCMRLNRNQRPSVDELLNHKFFNREYGTMFFDLYEESLDSYESEYDYTDDSIDLEL